MAGELLAQITPADLYRESTGGYGLLYQSVMYGVGGLSGTPGQSRGLSLQKFNPANLREYYNGNWIVPAAVLLATGLTFRFQVSDDGNDPNDLGKVIVLEVTPFNLSAAGATMDYGATAASMGTVTTGNVTLSATAGNPVIASIAIVAANLKSLAAGNILGMRLRRVGDNTSDTCNGRIILYGGIITNT